MHYNKRRSETPLAKFEECLQRLEKIVQELEKGEVPLEKSLTLFEEGMQLSFCLPEGTRTGGRESGNPSEEKREAPARTVRAADGKGACKPIGVSSDRVTRQFELSVELRFSQPDPQP